MEQLLRQQQRALPGENTFTAELAAIAGSYGPSSSQAITEAERVQNALREFTGRSDEANRESVDGINNAFVWYDVLAANRELSPLLSRRFLMPTPGGSAETFTTWSCKADPTDLGKFAVWHWRRHRRFKQHLAAHREELVHGTMERTRQLASLDVIPRTALQIMGKIATNSSFKAVDFMDAGSMSSRAYYQKGIIYFANLFEDQVHFAGIGDDFQITSHHEHLHNSEHYGYGFSTGIDTFQPYDGLVEEMTATHLSVVASPNNTQTSPQVIKPSQRKDTNSASYQAIREFFGEVDDLPIDLLGAAFFSKHGSKPRRQLEAHIDKRLPGKTKYIDVSRQFNDRPSYRAKTELIGAYTRRLAETRPIDKPASDQYGRRRMLFKMARRATPQVIASHDR